MADPKHPWSKFSTGNLATLRDNVPPGFSTRDALMDLHKRYATRFFRSLSIYSSQQTKAR